MAESVGKGLQTPWQVLEKISHEHGINPLARGDTRLGQHGQVELGIVEHGSNAIRFENPLHPGNKLRVVDTHQ